MHRRLQLRSFVGTNATPYASTGKDVSGRGG